MSKLRGRSYLLRGGLFERLARQSDDGACMPLYETEIDSLFSSIKRNLHNILNTRGGGALSSPYLGVGDFNDAEASSVNMLKSISGDIKSTIEEFEPRIHNILIEPKANGANPLRIELMIVGDVLFRNETHSMEFNLLIDKGSKCKIY